MASVRAQEEAERAREAKRRAESRAEDLRKKQRELEEAAAFRERLIGIIGHDLKNPLSAIIMTAQDQLLRGRLAREDVESASRIVRCANRMARMISQLVDFTRARLGGGFELDLAPADLGTICRDITDELAATSATELVQTVEGDVGGVWDADRLSQVISNIASNAVDHATRGTPVTIHAFGVRDEVVAEITNRGACIAPDLLPHIFSPFRRARVSSYVRTEHLGLGLYIAHEMVSSHGGTLDVRSARGRTTFTIRLPRVSSCSADALGSNDYFEPLA